MSRTQAEGGIIIYCDLAHPKGRPPWQLKDRKPRPRPEYSLPLVQALPTDPKSLGNLLGRLPTEILADIVSRLHGENETLCNLALANSGCCKLARAVLFAHLYLDYSPGSVNLLAKLASEQSGVVSIRPCVRAVTVHTRHSRVHDSLEHLSKEYGVSIAEASPEQLDELNAQGTSLYFETFLTPILDILDKRLLLNLQILSWRDKLVPIGNRVTSLVASGAREVDLDFFTTEPLEWDARTIPPPNLRSLRVCIKCHRAAISKACYKWHLGLLQWCAPTLESLEWEPLFESLPTSPLLFPSLRRLVSLRGNMRSPPWPGQPNCHSEMLSKLLFPNINVLDLGEITQAGVPALLSLGLPRLEAFSIRGIQSPEVAEQVTTFLSRHAAGLERLGIEMVCVSIMESHILPLLGSGFPKLKSLRLWWSEGYTENNGKFGFEYEPVLFGRPDDLSQIASITTLEQLCISVGDGEAPACVEVRIPYDIVRRGLAPLVNLKKMAFLKDKNIQKPLWLPPAMNRTFMLREEVVDMSDKRPELDGEEPTYPEGSQEYYYYLWRRGHRNMMLDVADAYVETFPHLEWMYCGMLELGFSRNRSRQEGSSKRSAAYVLEWPETNNWETAEPVRRVFAL